MELNYRNLIRIIPFRYKTHFDRVLLCLLITEDGKGFRPFYLRKGFLNIVKEENPDVNQDDLKLFYGYYTTLIRNTSLFFRNYRNHKSAVRLYPNYRFVYDKSYDLNDNPIGEDFEILNNLVLPINDPFWKFYYPPNFINDRCTVINTDEVVKEFERDKAPVVGEEFQIDFFDLFENNFAKFEDSKIESKPFVSVNINTDDIFLQSLYKIANKHGVSKAEVDEIMNKKNPQ